MLAHVSILALVAAASAAQPRAAVVRPAAVVADKVADRFAPLDPEAQVLGGVLGARHAVNVTHKLLAAREDELLAPFRARGTGAKWIGEHAGKFIDAASAAWAATGDPALKQRLDGVVRGLLATQEPDGYLGTYLPAARWTSWDVWVHKYDLIGLMAYYRVTGDGAALAGARKVGDLLVRTFGAEDGGGTARDILAAGEHLGMAATSVLEPMCHLYRYTGDARYLAFARALVRAWDQPKGPKILTALREHGSVLKTANAKAYEMISNLVGALELYRLTGDEALLPPAVRAWSDIVEHRLFVTGSTSNWEHFQEDGHLPGETHTNPGEGCVTVTWMQLTWHLLRLTGEARYAHELERTVHNHLLGAQHRKTGNVCSYPPLMGRKTFAGGLTYCCTSSVPRGIALVPQLAWGRRDGGVQLNLYGEGTAQVTVGEGAGAVPVAIAVRTAFPREGRVAIEVRPQRRTRFPLVLRVPPWADSFTATVGGSTSQGKAGEWLTLDRAWRPRDVVRVEMTLGVRVLEGGRTYPGRLAVQRGPEVLALEPELNPGLTPGARAAAALDVDPARVALRGGTARVDGWRDVSTFEIDGRVPVRSADGALALVRRPLRLVPFADAESPLVWLASSSDATPPQPRAATLFGAESASRGGSADGSIADGHPATFRNTYDKGRAAEDWFAVELPAPRPIARVVYRHGTVDRKRGGWFVTAQGKPRVEIRRAPGAPWETIGRLDAYPEVKVGEIPKLVDGQAFEVSLPDPVEAVAVRVVGVPGPGPEGSALKRNSASCAELAAFAP